jgi:HEAT repeat protein
MTMPSLSVAPRFVRFVLAALPLATVLAAQAGPAERGEAPPGAPNPYRLTPFEPEFPVVLEYPPQLGLEYVRTRRQILERLAANLQGNVRRDAWLLATEFWRRAPEDGVEPLIAAMDRAFGKQGLDDVVKNCVEAMGAMGDGRFDPPLRRALQHPNPVVQQAAFQALGTVGAPATVRDLAQAFARMDGRARAAYVRAVRLRLPRDEAIVALREIVMSGLGIAVRDLALKEALQLPAADAAAVLGGRWNEAVGEFKAILAGALHAAGDTRGTTWLLDSFAGEDLERMQFAVRHATFGELGDLRDGLFALATHPRADIRYELARALVRAGEEDVADTYELLIGPDETLDTRNLAMRELTRRGRSKAVEALLAEVPTASGTRLQQILTQLAASGDGRAVPILVERFALAPDGESRPFLQALSQNQSEAAAAALMAIYRGPEKVVGRGNQGVLTTRNYVPTLMLNLRGPERAVLAAFLELPKSDWRLRSPMLSTLSGIAADRADKELQSAMVEPLRRIVFDREELPQMRILALNLLARRWLTLDEVLRLRSSHRDEAPGMRAFLSDFLGDMF